MVQGISEKVLLGIQNGGESALTIKNFTGAFIDESGDNYVQNLTIESFDGFSLAPQETFSLAYDFFAFTSIQPKTYRL